MNCEFCTVKGRPRPASAGRLLEAITSLVEKHSAREFFIVDDLFGQDRAETLRFCSLAKRYTERTGRRLDLTVQIRLDKARDAQLLTAMREAGVTTVAIGFESPIDEELRAMNKRLTPRDMVSLARIYHNYGFLVHGMFIFGYPMREGTPFTMDADERLKRFRQFIKKAKVDTVQVLLPVPLPGTELRTRLERQHRIYAVADVGWEYYDGNFPLFEPDVPLTAESLQRAVRKIMGKFYQFKYMFLIGLHILPTTIYFLHTVRSGWRRRYRPWRNYLIRFGGWVTVRRWSSAFKKDAFSRKLQQAQEHLKIPRTVYRST